MELSVLRIGSSVLSKGGRIRNMFVKNVQNNAENDTKTDIIYKSVKNGN